MNFISTPARLLALIVWFSQPATGAETGRMTVTDYFLWLPAKGYFEDTPARILDFLRQPKCGGGR